MAKVEFELDQIAAYIFGRLNESGVVDSIHKLRTEFDLNPFDKDDDEYVGPWAEFRHNIDLIVEVAKDAVHLAELIVVDGISLTSAQKHEAVVKVLDDALRLPWYAEPFDGPAINIIVATVVKFFNGLGWVREIVEGGVELTMDAAVQNLEVATQLRSIEVAKVEAARQRRLLAARH